MKLSASALLFSATVLSLGIANAATSSIGRTHCILGLAPQGESVTIGGDSALTLNNCDIQSNGDASVKGNASVSTAINAVGLINVAGNASVPILLPFSPAAPDPFASVQAPPFSANCDFTNYSVNNQTNVTLSPGVYCNGISINNSQVTLSAGNYIIRNGDLKVRGAKSIVKGADVFIYLGNYGDESVGNLSLITQGVIDLKAQTSGAYSGVLVYQDRHASSSQNSNTAENEVSAGNLAVSGAVYTPVRSLSLSGASAPVAAPLCSVFVAKQIEISGNVSIDISCVPSGGGGSS